MEDTYVATYDLHALCDALKHKIIKKSVSNVKVVMFIQKTPTETYKLNQENPWPNACPQKNAVKALLM